MGMPWQIWPSVLYLCHSTHVMKQILCSFLALCTLAVMAQAPAPATRSVVITIDGKTYAGVLTEQPPAGPAAAESSPPAESAPTQTASGPVSLPAHALPKILMGPGYAYNQPVTSLPVDTRLIPSGYGANGAPSRVDTVDEHVRTWQGNYGLRLDTTIPWSVVNSKIDPGVMTRVRFAPDAYKDESDSLRDPLPVAKAKIEHADDPRADHHVLVYDAATGLAHELFGVSRAPDGGLQCVQYSRWDYARGSKRPNGWTSADAAGLPILYGLLRYDEAASGSIRHALRVTLEHSRSGHQGGYFIPPATHAAGDLFTVGAVMGQRYRLKAGVTRSGLTPLQKAVFECLKTYGLFLADNGANWLISGDDDPRWGGENLSNLDLKGSDFEVVDSGPIVDQTGQSVVYHGPPLPIDPPHR